MAAGGLRFSSRPWQLSTVSVKLWVRGRSSGKAERGRGTKPALIFGEKRCVEIFHRSDRVHEQLTLIQRAERAWNRVAEAEPKRVGILQLYRADRFAADSDRLDDTTKTIGHFWK